MHLGLFLTVLLACTTLSLGNYKQNEENYNNAYRLPISDNNPTQNNFDQTGNPSIKNNEISVQSGPVGGNQKSKSRRDKDFHEANKFLVHIRDVYNIHKNEDDPTQFSRLPTPSNENNNLEDFVKRLGYQLEQHRIETEDGYILTYHRVLKRETTAVSSRPVVLLLHGLAASSAVFLTPDKNALAYVLVESGFDVWLSNSRGNIYSRQHKSLNVNSREYWQFSLHEVAVFDLSAAIDFILRTTRQSKLQFVGHSHGATLALMLATVRTQYQSKISSLVAMAPIVYMDSFNYESKGSLAHTVLNMAFETNSKYESAGKYVIFQDFSELYNTYCQDANLCSQLKSVFGGTVNQQTWSQITQFLPAGTSTRSIEFVRQQILNGQMFRQFHSSQTSESTSVYTEEYNLSLIRFQVEIFNSRKDLFASFKDISRLQSKLQNSNLHSVESFSHLDFTWSTQAKHSVFTKIISILQLHSQTMPSISGPSGGTSGFPGVPSQFPGGTNPPTDGSGQIPKKDTHPGHVGEADIRAFVESLGYRLEEHRIQTEDGYILTYHRLVRKDETGRVSRPVVLLLHGAGGSSAIFLTPDRKALGYLLTEAGHDVWLANSRGNRYSREHIRFTTEQREFWDFSLHEMAVYDVSAAINFILRVTGQPKLQVVGHSHGATQIMVLASVRTEFQEKISYIVVLAPAVYLNNLPPVTQALIEQAELTTRKYEESKRYSIFNSVSELVNTFCKDPNECNELSNTVGGATSPATWKKTLEFIPSGVSTKLVHEIFQQTKHQGTDVRRYDYGPEGNRQHYQQTIPPSYDFSTIKNMIHIFYSKTDTFVSEESIMLLKRTLRNAEVISTGSTSTFNHFDFTLSVYAETTVFTEVMFLLKIDLKFESFVPGNGGSSFNGLESSQPPKIVEKTASSIQQFLACTMNTVTIFSKELELLREIGVSSENSKRESNWDRPRTPGNDVSRPTDGMGRGVVTDNGHQWESTHSTTGGVNNNVVLGHSGGSSSTTSRIVSGRGENSERTEHFLPTGTGNGKSSWAPTMGNDVNSEISRPTGGRGNGVGTNNHEEKWGTTQSIYGGANGNVILGGTGQSHSISKGIISRQEEKTHRTEHWVSTGRSSSGSSRILPSGNGNNNIEGRWESNHRTNEGVNGNVGNLENNWNTGRWNYGGTTSGAGHSGAGGLGTSNNRISTGSLANNWNIDNGGGLGSTGQGSNFHADKTTGEISTLNSKKQGNLLKNVRFHKVHTKSQYLNNQ